MELIEGYSSDHSASQPQEEEQKQEREDLPKPGLLSKKLNSAPQVNTVAKSTQKSLLSSIAKNVEYNAPVEEMWAPVVGPAQPYEKPPHLVDKKNVITGYVEPASFDDFRFHEMYHTYINYGYAFDPTGGFGVIGDTEQASSRNTATIYTKNEISRKRKLPSGNPAVIDGYLGPWAPFEEEVKKSEEEKQKKAEEKKERERKAAEGEKENDENDETEESEKKRPRGRESITTIPAEQAKSIFHGQELYDYQGRTYIDPPPDIIVGEEHECYVPKKFIHKYTGHTKGVQAIRFFPQTGHLLLSAGMDNKVKIWDVYNHRRCLRTFAGHGAAVRDICFTNDGRKFLSCSYDKHIKLWDTETGQCIGSYTNNKIPYCCVFNPDDDKQNVIMAGCSDKKIIQWDLNSGQITQKYDQHLGAVNTITFIDENRRFISTSDDKKILVWEFDLPVPIKYISEPHMHSIPAMSKHPSNAYVAGQSMDNQIVVYHARDRVRQHRKRFTGHINAGYAIQIGFSPDGHYITSGDSLGKLWIWDWGNCKMARKLNAHTNGPCIGSIWHPIEPSWLATCGWDGVIKLWD